MVPKKKTTSLDQRKKQLFSLLTKKKKKKTTRLLSCKFKGSLIFQVFYLFVLYRDNKDEFQYSFMTMENFEPILEHTTFVKKKRRKMFREHYRHRKM